MSNASEICFHYYFFIFPSDCRKSLSTHKGATNDYKIFHKARYGWVYEKKNSRNVYVQIGKCTQNTVWGLFAVVRVEFYD